MLKFGYLFGQKCPFAIVIDAKGHFDVAHV